MAVTRSQSRVSKASEEQNSVQLRHSKPHNNKNYNGISKMKEQRRPSPHTPLGLEVRLHFGLSWRVKQQKASEQATSEDSPQKKPLQNLTQEEFEFLTSSQKIKDFLGAVHDTRIESEFMAGVTVQSCALCGTNKIRFESPAVNFNDLDDYSHKLCHRRCCDKWVCKTCIESRIIESMKWDWARNLTGSMWISSPCNCGTTVAINRTDQFRNEVAKFRTVNVEALVLQFERASLLRDGLIKVQPPLSQRECCIWIEFYRELQNSKVAYDFFSVDSIWKSKGSNGMTLTVGDDIKIVTSSKAGIRIVFFMKFFRKRTMAQHCLVCTETFTEIRFENCHKLSPTGDRFSFWFDSLRNFPCMHILRCGKGHDICQTCVTRFVESKVEQLGQSACEQTHCPACHRVLASDEVQHFCSKETREKLQHYMTLNYLSKQKDFRWCLNSKCSSGEIFTEDAYEDPQVSCAECNFEMCFIHQVPYHHDVSCEEFDRQLAKEKVKLSNDKINECPSCQVPISKDGGCFHMTCTMCQYEFCAECGADWKNIDRRQNVDDDELDRTGHNPGCFFLTSMSTPLDIAGNSLQEAMALSEDEEFEEETEEMEDEEEMSETEEAEEMEEIHKMEELEILEYEEESDDVNDRQNDQIAEEADVELKEDGNVLN